MMKKKKNNKGFSLVELIVVIAIMAVLVGVLAPQFMGYVEKSREATDIQNLDSVRTQVEAYCADHENVTAVTVAIASTGTTATATVASGTEPTTNAIIGTSENTVLKSSRITALSATFTVSDNTWAYTLSGTNLFYTVNAAGTEIVVQ